MAVVFEEVLVVFRPDLVRLSVLLFGHYVSAAN
jgi:hypothetical protein